MKDSPSFFTALFNFSGHQRWVKKWYRLGRIKIIVPFFTSRTPVKQVAWGTAFGMFWTFTPTVGIQFVLLSLQWLLLRYLFRFNFDLKIGFMLLLLSNPLTVLPMYYVFWQTGHVLLGAFGTASQSAADYAQFSQQWALIFENQDQGTFQNLLDALHYLFIVLGEPMIIGSLIYAFLGALLGFVGIMYFLPKKRRKLAAKKNLSYEQWRSMYEKDYNF